VTNASLNQFEFGLTHLYMVGSEMSSMAIGKLSNCPLKKYSKALIIILHNFSCRLKYLLVLFHLEQRKIQNFQKLGSFDMFF